MIKENDLLDIAKKLFLEDELKLNDIPDIDLYMEQVTTFMDEKFSSMKRNNDDKILTKTMINNYTKNGIFMPPKNKKYSKDHMILMILVYHLKQIISLEDIKLLFSPILNDMSNTEDDIIDLSDIYSIFLDLKYEALKNFTDGLLDNVKDIQDKLVNLDDENKDLVKKFLIVIMLIAQSHAQKRLAEKIIDEYFK